MGNGGYLFVSFTGKEASELDEQIYFSVSRDGLNWIDSSDNKPVLKSTIGEYGIRDPYIIRLIDGTGYVIIATDLSVYHRGGWKNSDVTHEGSSSIVVWFSNDLKSWSSPNLIQVVPPDVGCVWAPEAIYDSEKSAYFVYWASKGFDGKDRLVILGSYTTDFLHFSDPEVFIDRLGNQDIIDTDIVHTEKGYVRASRDGAITIEFAENLHDRWNIVTTLQSLKLGISEDSVEGPEFVKLTDEWCLYVDQYSSGRGYLPILTKELTSTNKHNWKIATHFDFGRRLKRHGSILAINECEFQMLSSSIK